MDPFEFEFAVDPKHSYVTGNPPVEGGNIHVAANKRMALIVLEKGEERLSGIRISPEDMDKLCKEWTDARRVCPFCHKPGMDVVNDEQPQFGYVETGWECEDCGGFYSLQIIPDSVPWKDPLEGTR